MENNIESLTALENIPDDIMLEIFSYMSPSNLGNVALVNKRFERLSSNDTLWKHFLVPQNNPIILGMKTMYIIRLSSRLDKWKRFDKQGRAHISKRELLNFIARCLSEGLFVHTRLGNIRIFIREQVLYERIKKCIDENSLHYMTMALPFYEPPPYRMQDYFSILIESTQIVNLVEVLKQELEHYKVRNPVSKIPEVNWMAQIEFKVLEDLIKKTKTLLLDLCPHLDESNELFIANKEKTRVKRSLDSLQLQNQELTKKIQVLENNNNVLKKELDDVKENEKKCWLEMNNEIKSLKDYIKFMFKEMSAHSSNSTSESDISLQGSNDSQIPKCLN